MALSIWCSAADFTATVDRMRDAHGTFNLDQAGSVFKDAFIANACANKLSASHVRLGADPPDFELSWGLEAQLFEAVEVIAPGRRRGDELRAERDLTDKQRLLPVHVPEGEWTRAEDALNQVKDAVFRKCGMRYASGTNLVIYVNVGFVAGRGRLAKDMAVAAGAAFGFFNRVWALENGELRELVILPPDNS